MCTQGRMHADAKLCLGISGPNFGVVCHQSSETDFSFDINNQNFLLKHSLASCGMHHIGSRIFGIFLNYVCIHRWHLTHQ